MFGLIPMNMNVWRTTTFVLVGGLFLSTAFFLPHVYGDDDTPAIMDRDTDTRATTTNETISKEFIDTPIFKENEQSKVVVHPTFSDSSTNIAFYIKCPNPSCVDIGTVDAPLFIFSAENLGQDPKPFSEYWAPPSPSDYIAIEYKNDDQQFTCSDKTVEECKNDPHFVSFFEFALVSNETDITPLMLASKNSSAEETAASNTTSDLLTELSINLSAPSITSDLSKGEIVTAILDNASSTPSENSAASDALKKLSIDLSAPSITSDLSNGEIVTAILDNKPSLIPVVDVVKVVEEPEVATSSSSVGGIILGIVNSIIDVFTPDTPLPVEPTPTPTSTQKQAPTQTPDEAVTKPEPTAPGPEPEPATTSNETLPSVSE